MNSSPQSILSVASSADAGAQLSLINKRRLAAQRLAGAVWFPLLAGSVANLVAPVAASLIGGVQALGWYWGFAGPAIGVACAIFYARRPIHLQRHIAPLSWILAVGLVVVPVSAGIWLGGSADGFPLLAVAAGLGGFGALLHSRHVAVVAVAHVMGSAALYVSPTERTATLTFVALGVVGCTMAAFANLNSRGARP